METGLIILTAGVFLTAGFVKGVVGMGLPIVVMGLLGLAVPPAEAAALLVIPAFVTNVRQFFDGGPVGPIIRRLGGMMAGICLGTLGAVLLLPSAMGDWATAALGAVLVTSATMNLVKLNFTVRPQTEKPLSGLVGVATGFVTVSTGVAAVPSAIFLRALAMSREEFIQSLGLSFSVASLTLAGALTYHGVYQADVAAGSLLALIPALVGMRLGAACRGRLNPKSFKLAFDASMLVIGSVMIAKVLF